VQEHYGEKAIMNKSNPRLSARDGWLGGFGSDFDMVHGKPKTVLQDAMRRWLIFRYRQIIERVE